MFFIISVPGPYSYFHSYQMENILSCGIKKEIVFRPFSVLLPATISFPYDFCHFIRIFVLLVSELYGRNTFLLLKCHMKSGGG